MQRIMTILLTGTAILAGIVMLIFGIKDTVDAGRPSRGYLETEGRYAGCSVYSSDDDGTTYRLTYSYTVGGREYTVTTDYGTGILPEPGSTRTVRYDPDDPARAVIPGGSSGGVLIFMGIFFIAVPAVILTAMFASAGFAERFLTNLIEFGIGIVLMAAGAGIVYLMTGSLSPVRLYSSFSSSTAVLLTIPLLLFAAGAFVFVKTVYSRVRELVLRKRSERGGR